METVKRAFEKNNVAVLLTSSDLYAPYAGVVVESIIENSSEENNYDILIFETDISNSNKKKLMKMCEKKSNVSLRCVDISSIMDKYELHTLSVAHKKYNFYRLAVLDALPEYDKIIYLDSDLIVNCDLAELYNMELGDNYLAATKCFRMSIHCNNPNPIGKMAIPMRQYFLEELKLKNPDNYFNSGVMLLSLNNLRKKYTSSYLLDEASTTTFPTVEQDLLNLLCEEKVVFLPQVWNYICAKGNGMEKNGNKELYEEWLKARDNNKIWHYLGGGSAIPCNSPTIDGAEHFWKYAVNTPFIDELFSRLDKDISTKVNALIAEKKVDDVLTTAEKNKEIKEKSAESSPMKRLLKKFVPYGSPTYLALKGVYFKLKKKPFEPVVDIINSKIINKDNQKVKIYVSRQSSVNSYVVNNPVFQDIRCGASHDKFPSLFLGDDTGENISQMSITFRNMTVMYWAWKNENAEYFGLCEHDKYPSFAGYSKKTEPRGLISEDELNKNNIKKYKLNQKKLYEKMASKADIWVTAKTRVAGSSLMQVKGKTVFELCMTQHQFYDPSFALVTLKLIDDQFPEYSKAAHDYFGQEYYYAGDCFLMKKELFDKMCEFIFSVLFKLDANYNFSVMEDNKAGTPGYMAELLYGIFVTWAIQHGHSVKATSLVSFANTVYDPITSKKLQTSTKQHNYLLEHSQEYRMVVENSKKIRSIQRILANSSDSRGILYQRKTALDNETLTDNTGFSIACFAEQVHAYHKAAFAEFKNCHTDKAVAIIATGPTLNYYTQIKDIPHIGMNASFTAPNVTLDYYFTTDYKFKPDWFEKLKYYDFIKFFGQYSIGGFQQRFQVNERIIRENNGRRFFQGAPSEDIYYDIEFYPLAGFFTIALQALHFALYTNAKRIYLVGCDCNTSGYFNSPATQVGVKLDAWIVGYKKMKEFATKFYPDTDIISVNPEGLRGMFHDVYTEDYLNDHPEINREFCEIVDFNTIEAEMEKRI